VSLLPLPPLIRIRRKKIINPRAYVPAKELPTGVLAAFRRL
jgi:hypothetical protein